MTVTSPFGSADLAVPVGVPLAGLLPVLVWHTVPEAERGSGWVLQRLGGAPLDLECTVGSADLREGEQLHLRPVHDTLPELAYDDLPDGLAESIRARRELWRPLFTKVACLLAAVVMAVIVAVGLVAAVRNPVPHLVLAGLALTGTYGLVRKRDQPVLGMLLTGIAALFAAGAGIVTAPDDVSAFLLAIAGVAAACAVGAAIMMQVRRAVTVLGGVVLTGLWLGLLVLLVTEGGVTPLGAAGAVVTGGFVVLVGCSRFALRMARVQGPQLPRTAEELQQDIDPEPADTVRTRARWAAGYVTMFVSSASLVIVLGVGEVLSHPGWAPLVFIGLVATALMTRARGFVPAAQRGPVLLAGAVSALGLYAKALLGAGSLMFWLLIALGVLAVVALLAASVRLMSRAPVPMWRRVGDVLEVVTVVAIVPMLGQLFGLYSFFRGLGG
ncbi:type VII secretion integral membrane protein EccD [Amycolatopsis antarctica]|uniref:Type VII secretion integral membrane protein EccD n=2 Tax=Amycolatopsis antarctica TaxID=1854586 RepID=A0A263D0Y9_9PSEU|nr:type VII secretion integral membrane protein EccD [Amycolatopsis antarctica]